MSTSSPPVEVRWNELESVAPIRPATDADAIDGLGPTRVAAPETEEQVSAILAWANEHDVHVIARGGATKQSWGNQPRSADLVLSLEKFNCIIDHAWQDMTVTVQAGVTLATLQAELAKHGQRLPLDALWPERSTLGGLISTNDSGPLRLRFGSLRDLLLGVTVVLANGSLARSGGRVVKNVAGYDLPKLFIGAYGTLGVLTEVTLRTYPLPHAVRDVSFQFADAASANHYMLAIADTTLVPASMQLRTAPDRSTVVDVRFEGLAEGIEAQLQRCTQLASAAPSTSSAEIWSRESFFSASALVAKFSVLPSKIADAVNAIQSHFPTTKIAAQSIGLGLLRVEFTDPQSLIKPFSELRIAFRELGGTLVLLQAPREIKNVFDIFGERTSAFPLMSRIKQQFDPKGTLSPGRFLGGL